MLQRVWEQLWTLPTGSQAVSHKQVITGHGYVSLPVQAVFLDQAIKSYFGIYGMEIEISLWEEQKTLGICTSSQLYFSTHLFPPEAEEWRSHSTAGVRLKSRIRGAKQQQQQRLCIFNI